MREMSIRRPADCHILVCDDEPTICEFIKDALADTYPNVETCFTAGEAIRLLRGKEFDLVITDLRLPDMSGIEVLRFAKEKDEHLEVIIITGYGSLESAAEAINLGVTSYLFKPLDLDDFIEQADRAVSRRLFHLKSKMLMSRDATLGPEAQDHVLDVTTLYYFSRKLMLSLEMPEIMRVILEEANSRVSASLSVLGVRFPSFSHIYAMPGSGSLDPEKVRENLLSKSSATGEAVEREAIRRKEIPVTVFAGRKGAEDHTFGTVTTYPLNILGKTVGFLSIFLRKGVELTQSSEQFLCVFTSMASSVIEHGYSDMQAKLQAKTDGLTGVANHRMLHETLEREISLADRKQDSFCLVLLDIDDFKQINDTHGHLVGDAVLIDLTKRVTSVIRKGDVVARYGGEEFALILHDTDISGAGILAQRICDEISGSPFLFSNAQITYTVSIGLAVYDGNSPTRRDILIGAADAALYKSKKTGKNKVSTA